MDGKEILIMDPNIVVSLVNMKLRDFYGTLENYCDDIGVDKSELINHLAKAGYEYNEICKQFK